MWYKLNRTRGGQMAIQRYSKNEMQAIISNILQENVSITPIGNHELRRHLVYRVETQKGTFVFKYYYQDIYGGREISTLKLLKDTQILHAPLVDHGTFGVDREWLMMGLLNGMPMDKVAEQISKENHIEVYRDMGIALGQIHESHTFDQFGDLKADGTFNKGYSNYTDAFVANNIYCYDKIYNLNDHSKDIYIQGIKKVENNLHLLDHVKEARLTHLDFSPRNIFLETEGDQTKLKAVLDFELCRPWDKNADFCQLILRDFSGHPDYEKAFYQGYNSISSIDESFEETLDFYLLNLSLQVCSWAKDVAPDYYNMAFNTLQRILKESKYLK